MNFGLEKCATLSMKRGNVADYEGIDLLIRALPTGSGYKILVYIILGRL